MKDHRTSKLPPEHLIFIAIVAGVFTWFGFSALGAEQIRMGLKGRSGLMIARCDQPNEYWFSVGWFLFFTALGWFALGLSVCRMMRNRNRPQPKGNLSTEK